MAYFDHADMLARFDKQNGFLTPWGLHGYRDAGRPIYREAMERRTVPLLLANWFTIQDALAGVDDIFLPEDNRALRNNYLRFEGPIWLAGKEVTNPMPEEEEFLVPGPYTVHGAPVTIDGEKHQTGSIVEIARGNHRVSADTGPARLVWGRNLKPSGDDALQGSQWVRF